MGLVPLCLELPLEPPVNKDLANYLTTRLCTTRLPVNNKLHVLDVDFYSDSMFDIPTTFQ